jgi:hypothetical protein
MPAFDPDGDLGLDYQLVQNGFVTLFWDEVVLRTSTAWLAGHGYQVVVLDGTEWTTRRDLCLAIGRALDFPADFRGNSLDAFQDWLRSVAWGEFGLDLDAAGLVLVLEHYHHIAALDTFAAHAVLDCFAQAARLGALFGHRMLCLVQTDDPLLSFPTIGATAVGWNRAEASYQARGLHS